jgi:hypothetical protein
LTGFRKQWLTAKNQFFIYNLIFTKMFKEIFSSIILSLFYADGAWLNELTSLDHMVDNNTINLSVVGADPGVVKNNTTWPLTPVQRTDSGIIIPLATFDTTPTHVTNVEELETNYNKAQSVVTQHVNVLRLNASKSAAYNTAPATTSASTPIIKTTGATNANGNKALTFADITQLSLSFDNANIPQEGRILVLCPEQKQDLKNQDISLFKKLIEDNTIDGFKIYTFTGNPTYTIASGVATKNAYGTVTGKPSSIAFAKSEVMRAMGSIEGEPEKRWADYRGWLLGFQMRFVAQPFRALGYGSLVSA